MTLSWYLINITCSQDPKETPPPTRGETRDEKTERKVHIKYLYEKTLKHFSCTTEKYGARVNSHEEWLGNPF